MVFSNNLIMGAAGAGGAGYTIDQSIRFNDDDSAHMNRIFGAGGTPKTFTTGCWFKVASFGDVRGIINSEDNSGSALDDFIIRLSAADKLEVIYKNTSNVERINWTSDFVLRDPAAWYFVAVTCDTTPATPIFKVFCNAAGTSNWDCDSVMTKTTDSLAQNDESSFLRNSNEAHIGAFYNASAGNYFDGYMAEIFIQDGVVITDPFTDGYVKIDENGVYKPLDLSGKTFGTQGGLYLGSDSADLGADDSGNGNDFTSSGLTSADQRLDSPTLNKATLNGVNLYTTGSVLSDGNLTVTNSGTSGFWRRAYATQALSYKTYWEVHADNLGSLNMGLSSLKNPNGGINNPAGNFGAGIQTNEAFVTGSYANESSGSRTFPISTGNYVMFAFDPDRGALWAGTEGTWKDGTASSPSSATILAEIEGTGTSYALFTGIDADDAIPHIAQYSTSTATARFSSEDWEGTAPTGYEQLAPSSLPDPTIADPTAYMQSTLYTGNGVGSGSGGQEINQSENSTFQPDFVWIKVRNLGTETHCLQDVVRGADKRVQSSSSAAENTETEGLLSFDSDGFTVGSRDPYNKNTATYVGWQWLADNTTGSSNTDGSVTSTVSNNSTSNFSIVKYTGTGSGSSTVGHGLGVTPDMIILKHLDRSQNWRVFHTSEGVGETGFLNSTAVFSADPDRVTAVSSTTFTAAANMNESADYIAYCFAEVEGFSKFGSYTGNGSTDGPFIYTGFTPSFIMYKRTSGGTGNWDMLDIKRDPINVSDAVLAADKTTAETTYSTIKIDIVSNGYKIRGTQTNLNSSGSAYIYMAFASSPFKTATAR